MSLKKTDEIVIMDGEKDHCRETMCITAFQEGEKSVDTGMYRK
ncbi:MAG: hypothetical protein ACLUOI_28045 [Eisenbergiella sp.]